MKTPIAIVPNDFQSEILVYESPKIEVVEISVESGFAGSGTPEEWGDKYW